MSSSGCHYITHHVSGASLWCNSYDYTPKLRPFGGKIRDFAFMSLDISELYNDSPGAEALMFFGIFRVGIKNILDISFAVGNI